MIDRTALTLRFHVLTHLNMHGTEEWDSSATKPGEQNLELLSSLGTVQSSTEKPDSNFLHPFVNASNSIVLFCY